MANHISVSKNEPIGGQLDSVRCSHVTTIKIYITNYSQSLDVGQLQGCL